MIIQQHDLLLHVEPENTHAHTRCVSFCCCVLQLWNNPPCGRGLQQNQDAAITRWLFRLVWAPEHQKVLFNTFLSFQEHCCLLYQTAPPSHTFQTSSPCPCLDSPSVPSTPPQTRTGRRSQLVVTSVHSSHTWTTTDDSTLVTLRPGGGDFYTRL